MSSGGQGVGGVVGAIIGFVASGGNPMAAVYGAQFDMAVGEMISPPKSPTIAGPELPAIGGETCPS